MLRPLRRGLTALASVLLLTPLLVLAQPAQAVLGDVLWFGSTVEGSTVKGANSVVKADGAISTIMTCLPGGTNDFPFAVSDIYIVESGSAAPFADLEQADGTSPATVIGSGSTGMFIEEILAVTGPQGQLGEGVYDVVFDNCQDGKYTPTEDSVHSGVVTVKFPAVLPPYSTWIGNLKRKAHESAAVWAVTNRFMESLRRMNEGEQPLTYRDVLAERPADLLGLIDELIGKYNKVKSGLTLPRGPGRPIEWAMNLAANQGKHYLAIAEDPPDHDYQHSTVIEPFEVPLPDEQFEPFTQVQSIGTAAATEGAVSAAFLRSLERYQGATYANDAEWTMVHARELEQLATTLAALNEQTADRLDALSGSLDQLPGWDRVVEETVEFLGGQAWHGWSAEEERTLANLGVTGDERNELLRVMREEAHWFSNAANRWSMREVEEHLPEHAATQREMAAELTALAERLRGVQAELTAQSAVPDDLPTAHAGGPYTATAGVALALDGSASTPGDGRSLTGYEWDTDGDGEFDDATGATASVSVGAASPALVGLRVTDDAGKSSVAYSPVEVDRGAVPTVGNVPEHLSLEAFVGEELALDPEVSDGAAVEWLLDDEPFATGPAFRYTPTEDELGVRTLRLTVTDDAGRSVRKDWYIAVVRADADADGWSATADCVDTDPLINPGRTEVVGNRIDDDCNPGTADLPLDRAPGPALSWGVGDEVRSESLGRSANDTFPADKPNEIRSLGHRVAQVIGGDQMGLAIDTDGALWAWGFGQNGRLGHGANSQAFSPTAVRSPSGSGQLGVDGPKVLAADTDLIGVALLDDGTAAAWGPNTDGALGTGSTAAISSVPAVVRGGDDPLTEVTAVASARTFAAFVAGDELWATAGACGTSGGTTARRVDGLPAEVVQLAGGDGFVIALLTDGSLYRCDSAGGLQPVESGEDASAPARIAAGRGFFVLLDSSDRVWAVDADGTGLRQVTVPDGPAVSTLTAGGDRAALIRADGSLLTFHHGDTEATSVDLPDGVLANHVGLGTTTELNLVVTTKANPVVAWGGTFTGTLAGWPSVAAEPFVTALPAARDIWSQHNSAMGYIDSEGRVWSWGQHYHRGQGYQAEPLVSSTPGPVLGVGGQPGTQLRAQRFVDTSDPRTVRGVLLDGGQLAVWGTHHHFGDGQGRTAYYHPTMVRNAGNDGPLADVTQAALGQHNSLALHDDGTVMTWGLDACHRIGAPAALSPTEMSAFGDDNRKVMVNREASFALKRDGSLVSCGNPRVAATGRPAGTDADHTNVGLVPGMGPGSVADIVATSFRVMVLKHDGTIWTWGHGGNNSRDHQWTPQQVELPEGPPVVSMHLGQGGFGPDTHFAIRADGSVLAWGANPGGNIGIPGADSYVETPTLVPMPDGRPVSTIAGGYSGLSNHHYLALVGDPMERLAEQRGVGIEASVADATVSEGGTARVDVSLNYPAGADIDLDFETADGSAVAGADYEATVGRVTVPAGETSAVIEVPTIGNETTQAGVEREFAIRLTPVLNWVDIVDEEATVSIADDDPLPAVSISGPAEPVAEGDAGSRDVELTLTLDRPSSAETTVTWRTEDGSGHAPADYLPGEGTVTFAPGETATTISVGVNGDEELETEEKFNVVLFDPHDLTIGAGSAEVTVADDEPVLVSASDQQITAPSSGEEVMSFTISAPQVLTGETVTVPWSVSAPWQDGDPTPAGVTGSGEVTLTPDEPLATVEVTVAAGERAEPQFFRLVTGEVSSSAGREVIASPGLGTVTPTAVGDLTVAIDGPHTADEGSVVTLTATGVGGTAPLEYAWDTDADGEYDDGTGSSIGIGAASHGELAVTVRVTDAEDRTASASHTITVNNVAPVVAAIADQVLVPGQELNVAGSFTDPGENEWTATVDFGDRPQPLTLDGTTFVIEHAEPVTGTVTVSVCDDAGACGSTSFTVTVAGTPPPLAAVITGPAETGEGTSVTLSASASTGAGPLEFAWDIDGDGQFDDGTGPSIDVPTPRHGTLAVRLRVTDVDGESVEAVHKVTVKNVAPMLATIADQVLAPGQELSVTGSFIDPGENEWTATVDFGDGPRPLTLDGTTFTIAQAEPVSGTVTVTVCDDAGACDQTSFTVTVQEPAAPVASIKGPTQIGEGSTGTFTAAGSTGEGDLVFAWDTDGDGEFDDADTAEVTIDFRSPGTRVISLQVTDSRDVTAAAEHTVTVTAVAPTVEPIDDWTVQVGQTFEITGSFTDPGDNEWTATVDYGEGPDDLILDGTTFQLSHVYRTPGARTVTVQVCDDHRACGSAKFTVTVPEPAPDPRGGDQNSPSVTVPGIGTIPATGPAVGAGLILLALAGIVLGGLLLGRRRRDRRREMNGTQLS